MEVVKQKTPSAVSKRHHSKRENAELNAASTTNHIIAPASRHRYRGENTTASVRTSSGRLSRPPWMVEGVTGGGDNGFWTLSIARASPRQWTLPQPSPGSLIRLQSKHSGPDDHNMVELKSPHRQDCSSVSKEGLFGRRAQR